MVSPSIWMKVLFCANMNSFSGFPFSVSLKISSDGDSSTVSLESFALSPLFSTFVMSLVKLTLLGKGVDAR